MYMGREVFFFFGRGGRSFGGRCGWMDGFGNCVCQIEAAAQEFGNPFTELNETLLDFNN